MFARRRDIFIRKLAMQFFSVMSNLMDAIAELVSLARHLVELSVSNLCAAGGFVFHGWWHTLPLACLWQRFNHGAGCEHATNLEPGMCPPRSFGWPPLFIPL